MPFTHFTVGPPGLLPYLKAHCSPLLRGILFMQVATALSKLSKLCQQALITPQDALCGMNNVALVLIIKQYM